MANTKFFTVLAFDFGTQHIGVAVSETATQQASPLPRLECQQGLIPWEEITHLIHTWEPAWLVVGVPLTAEGDSQPMSLQAKKFAAQLQQRYHRPVFEGDERWSSQAANSLLKRAPKGKKVDKDSLSAKLILESWFKYSSKENE